MSYPNLQYVAVGVHETKNGDGIIYLIPGTEMGRKIVGKIIKDDGSTFELLDERSKAPDGKQVQMIFEKLTLELLLEMGSRQIVDLDQLKKTLKSDEDVQMFYQSNFLQDYWSDAYKSGIRYE